MIHTEDLTRHFRAGSETVEAVGGISLDVAAGELVALLGPNGAGKSTTLRMLTTLLSPTSGTARVAGYDVAAEPARVRQAIGSIGQGHGASPNQRVRDELVDHARFYRLSRTAARERADELLSELDLTDLADRSVQQLSGGQKRRLDIAMGLVTEPALLFFDEPSTGLDPQNRANLADLIRRARDEAGTTVVFSTHYMDEADALADRVIIIDHGHIIADAPPQQLKADLAGDTITISPINRDDLTRTVHAISAVAGVAPEQVTVSGNAVLIGTACGKSALPNMVRALDTNGVGIDWCDVRSATLDDVFLALTGRNVGENPTPSHRHTTP